jgi:hypothetical protein
MTGSDGLYPKPGIRDWALLAIGIVFVLSGVIILPSNRDVGIVSLAMFGPATVVATTIILRKLRFRRQRALKAEIVGGVPIRQSRVLVITSGSNAGRDGSGFHPVRKLLRTDLSGAGMADRGDRGRAFDRRPARVVAKRLHSVRSGGNHIRSHAIYVHGAVGGHRTGERRTLQQ